MGASLGGDAAAAWCHCHAASRSRPRLSPVTDTSEIKFGALCWYQYTELPALLEAGVRADRLGYDTLWT